MFALVLVAAGSGQRLGAPVPKALVEVGGRTLIGHCLATSARVPRIQQTVVVAPAAHIDEVAEALAEWPVSIVPGSDSRDGSVRCGLRALSDGVTDVLIHDAARPFAPVEVYEAVIDSLAAGARAVVPAVPVADTVKRVSGPRVTQTLDRSELVAVQTPQGFDLAALREAHEAQRGEVTDDAMLMEQAGVEVAVVPGSQCAFKITTAFDLLIAEAVQESQ